VPVVPTVACERRRRPTRCASCWTTRRLARLQPPAGTRDEGAETRAPTTTVQRASCSAWAWTAVVPHTLASDRIDRVVLHPLAGPLLLALVLFLVFQAVFAWAEAPMGWIEAATAWLGEAVGRALPDTCCAACWWTA
jgi:ferrous iron transport protein B